MEDVKKDRGVTGEMVLRDYFWESPSGHKDESEYLVLSPASRDEVRLTVETGDNNLMPRGRSENNSDSYVIKVRDLVNLIRQHGRKV